MANFLRRKISIGANSVLATDRRRKVRRLPRSIYARFWKWSVLALAEGRCGEADGIGGRETEHCLRRAEDDQRALISGPATARRRCDWPGRVRGVNHKRMPVRPTFYREGSWMDGREGSVKRARWRGLAQQTIGPTHRHPARPQDPLAPGQRLFGSLWLRPTVAQATCRASA